MKDLSFIVPFRSDNGIRERNFEWSMDRLEKLCPSAQIVIADSGTEVFNRSEARNNAFNHCDRSVVVQQDADTVWNLSALTQAVESLENGAPWVIAYKDYRALDADSTSRLVDQPVDVELEPSNYSYDVESIDTIANGGFMALRRKDVFKVGGWDERFVGWGWEDKAFAHASNQILGQCVRLDQSIYHLWHPHSVEQTIHHPHYQENWRLYDQYVANLSKTWKAFL